MAKTFFALERPRRISINIPGYDAKRSTGDQQQQLKKQRKRGKKEVAARTSTPEPEVKQQAEKPPAPAPTKPRRQPGIEGLADVFDEDRGGMQ